MVKGVFFFIVLKRVKRLTIMVASVNCKADNNLESLERQASEHACGDCLDCVS